MATLMGEHVEAALAARSGLLPSFVAMKEAHIAVLELKLRFVECPADAFEIIEDIEHVKATIEEMKYMVELRA